MFSIRELYFNLSRAIKFNRFFLGVLSLELFIYYIQSQSIVFPLLSNLLTIAFLTVFIAFLGNEIMGKLLINRMVSSYSALLSLSKIIITGHFLLITVFVTCVNDVQSFILFLVPLSLCLILAIKDFTLPLILIGSTLYFVQSHFNIINYATFIGTEIYKPTWISYTIALFSVVYAIDLITHLIQYKTETNFMYRSLATLDGLTGLINRRYLNKRIEEEFSRAKRHKLKLAVAIIDVDHFKKINDTYGHTAGDYTLQQIADILKLNTRNSDIVARYGGEEFILVLPETSQKAGFELLDRIRMLIAGEIFEFENHQINVTISIGIAQLNYDASVHEFISRADKALYSAKNLGRNNVQIANRLISMKVAGSA